MTFKFRVGSVVYHAQALFGPGTVVRAYYDDEIEAALYEVQWQSSGQRLSHTEKSLTRQPPSVAGPL